MKKRELIEKYRAEYENALDDLYYGIGYSFWRTHNNRIESDDEAKRVWQYAIDEMTKE